MKAYRLRALLTEVISGVARDRSAVILKSRKAVLNGYSCGRAAQGISGSLLC